MTADVFASLQALPQTQTLQTVNQQTTSDETASLPGLFASLMNECIAEEEAADFSAQVLVIPENGSEPQNISQPQMMAFTGNKAFPQAVMNILAGEAEFTPYTPSPETMPIPEDIQLSPETSDDSNIVIWPDDEAAQKPTPTLADGDTPPEATEPSSADDILREVHELSPDDDIRPEVHEIPLANNVLLEVHESSSADDIPLKRPDSPVESVKASDDSEDTQEHEETPEIPEVSAEMAGLAGIVNAQPNITEHPEIHDTRTQPERSALTSQPARLRRSQHETHSAPGEHQNVTESQEVSTNFREAVVNRNTDTENSGQDSQQEPHSGNQSQSQNQSQPRKTDSRNLKTESATQTPAPESRRTESHSDFGAYFEGVLNSRRTTVRTSQPMPLNLRTAENFTQAAALRDGITNVVRFIRADGVQKARVIVDPPALGRVSVELTSGTSGVEASIKVASEQIRQLVQDQISQLRMNLSQQGVQVAEFTVDVQQDSSGNHNQQGQEQYAGRFGFVDDSDDDEAEDFRIDLEEGLLYWVA